MNPVLMVDWGGYDYPVQVEALAEKAGVRAFISQVGGAGTKSLLKRARAAGMLTGLYYWNSALIAAKTQVDAFSKWIDSENPDIIILDFEHYWAKWPEYWDYLDGKIPADKVSKLPPQKISDNGMAVAEAIKLRYPEKYFLDYSAAWFTYSYSPMSVNWLKKKPFHVASYPDRGNKYSLSWDQIKAGMFKHPTRGLQFIQNYKPSMPDKMVSWDIWQYSSRLMIPGERNAYDWNLFNGTYEQLLAKCKGAVSVTDPQPKPSAYRVRLGDNCWSIVLKERPGAGAVVKWLTNTLQTTGIPVYLMVESNSLTAGYLKVVGGGWINQTYVVEA